MAEKQIVREDVISISFEVDNAAAKSVQGMVDNLTGGAVREMQEMADKVNETADAIKDMKTPIADAADGLSGAGNEAATFAEKLKSAVNAGIDKLKHPIETVKSALGSAKEAAGNFVTKIKDIGKQKITSLVNSLKQVKTKLTEGKTGASGVLTALKNVAKVSMSALKSGLESVKDKLSSIVSKAGEAALKLGKITLKAAAAGVTAAATGIVAGLTACINVGKEYESAMSQVAATMGITADTAEYETLSAAAKEMGATTAFSATEAAEALNYLALAGYDADKAAGALPTVLNLAGAGAMDLATASDMVTDAMSALNIEATSDNLNEFADKMAVTAQKSNTSVQQLGEAILTVGGTAKNMAGGTTELNAALGTLANVGIKGAEGGTHLRNLLLSLQTPTDDATALLNKLGVSIYDASGNMRGINDIFKDIKSGTEGMSNAEVDNILSTIFNKTDLAAAQGMLSGCEDSFDSLVANIEDSSGACEDMYKTMLDNLDGDIAIFQSGLSALGNNIYEAMQEPLRGVVQDVTGIIGNLSDAFNEGGFTGLAGAVGDGLAKIINMITDYAPTIANLAVTMIQGLIDGLLNNMDSIADGLAETLKTLVSGLGTIIPQLFQGLFESALSMASSLAAVLPDMIDDLLNDLYGMFEDTPDLIDTGINIVMSLIDGVLNSIPVIMTYVPLLAEAWVDGLLSSIDMYIDAGMQLIDTLIDVVMECLPTLVQTAVQMILALTEGLLSYIPTLIDAAIELINSLIDGLIQCLPMIIDAAIELVIGLVQGIAQALPQIVNAAINLIYALINGLIECMPMIIQAAIQLIIGLVQGLIQCLPTLVQAAIQLIIGLCGGILQMLPELIAMGIQLVISLAVGIIQAIPQLIECIPMILQSIWEILTDIDFWLDLGKSIISGIWEGIKSIGSSIGNGIKSLFGGGSGEAEDCGLEAAQSYSSSLTSGLSTTSFDTSAFSSSLAIDMTTEGTESAASWSTGFDSALASGTANAANETTSTAEQLKSSMNVDLTSEGTESAASWSNGFTSGIAETSSSVQTAFSSMDFSSATNAFSKLAASADDTKASVGKQMSGMADTVKKQCSVIKTQVTDTAKKIKSAFSSINLKSVGADIMTGLLNGLKSKETELLNYVKNLAKSIPTTMETNLDIGSPSRVMYEIGGFTAEGLINGISDSIPRAQDTSERLGAAVTYGDTENVYTGGNTHTETNTYSPVFNLTISGSSSDRDMERKVKRWIKECLNDIDASAERKSPIMQEL